MEAVDVVSTSVAAVALVVSLIVARDTRRREQQAARLARQPALVFDWDGSTKTWRLRNIGNGPALDVVIAQRIGSVWTNPLRMPEMPVDGSEVVPRRWVEKTEDPGLGARYRSIAGEEYATRTGDDMSQIHPGAGVIPIDNAAIERHWQYRSSSSTSR